MKRLSEKQKYIEWAIFAGTLLILCFFLARYTVYTLDSDAASELVFAKHLADQGGAIMSKNWYYSTEIEFLSDQLAFELMFFFTDNWRIVRLGGHAAAHSSAACKPALFLPEDGAEEELSPSCRPDAAASVPELF